MIKKIRDALGFDYIPPANIQISVDQYREKVEFRVVIVNDEEKDIWLDGYAEPYSDAVAFFSSLVEVCQINCYLKKKRYSIMLNTGGVVGWAFVRGSDV